MTDEELFPHSGFPVRLEYDEGKEHKICWFQCENHLQKHLTRYKLKQNEIIIHRYGEKSNPDPVPTTTRKRTKSTKGESVRAKSKPKSNAGKSRTAKATQEPKKRGRPKKAEATTQPKKRGRPKKVKE